MPRNGPSNFSDLADKKDGEIKEAELRKPKTDTRRFARYDILEYAMVYHPDSQEPVRSVVVNVGLGGVQVLSRMQLQTGDLCQVILAKSDGTRMTMPGEVRYSNPFNGSGLFSTGMRFTPETEAQRTDVVDYVHSVFQRQAEQLAG